MAVDRKPFLLRLDPATIAALRAWAADDLRSLNGQIEFLLRRSLREAGRLPARTNDPEPIDDESTDGGVDELAPPERASRAREIR